MSFFNSRLRYALCAAVDLAIQPTSNACQSREIASRQDIPGPYLDQILSSLKSAGIVKSVRGAGGGYNLARQPDRIMVGDVVRAVMRTDKLFAGSDGDEPPPASIAWVVRDVEQKVECTISDLLDNITLADLVSNKAGLDDALSYMPSL